MSCPRTQHNVPNQGSNPERLKSDNLYFYFQEMSEEKASFSLLPSKPPVTTDQAVTMATQLFNLYIEDTTSVKELHSYDDRNFFMRGSLMREEKKIEVSGCKEYILRISNHVDSSHECLTEVQCNTMLFLQSRGYHCPVPVPSILNTYFVKCKIPRGTQPRSVALETDGVTLETESAALKNDNVSAETNVSFESEGVMGSGIEVYDGKEYSEENFFVCDVRLLVFVPGKVLDEVPLNTELLFNAGMAVGRLDRDLEVSDNTVGSITSRCSGKEPALLSRKPVESREST